RHDAQLSPSATWRPLRARVHAAPGPTVRASRAAAIRPSVMNPGARRILHLSHLRNLPGILGIGRILADAAGAAPVVDLSAPDTRRRRRETVVSGRSVAEFVPFFLAPEAALWMRMRGRLPDERLAEEARRRPASEFVLLVS